MRQIEHRPLSGRSITMPYNSTTILMTCQYYCYKAYKQEPVVKTCKPRTQSLGINILVIPITNRHSQSLRRQLLSVFGDSASLDSSSATRAGSGALSAIGASMRDNRATISASFSNDESEPKSRGGSGSRKRKAANRWL
jgi:hypothetical protein